jgi:20S proteasome subunit beta 5
MKTLFFKAYHVKSTGWVKISEEDVTDLHYKYKELAEQARR